MKSINSSIINFVKFFALCVFLFAVSATALAAPTISFKVGTLSGDRFSVSEVSRQMELVAVLSEPVASPVTFTYALVPNASTATRSADFRFNDKEDPTQRSLEATATFSTGQTELPISIEIVDDILKEDNEVIRFNMKGAPQGISFVDDLIDIVITDNEAIPLIVLSVDGKSREADGSITAAIDEADGVAVILEIVNNPSSSDIQVTYEIGYNPQDDLNSDFNIESNLIVDADTKTMFGTLTIPALENELEFDVFAIPDVTPEEQETLTLKILSDPQKTSGAVVHETQNTLVLTINDIDGNAGAINDTGVTHCYDENNMEITGCASADFPEQDGDNVDNTRFNRFVKLDGNGIKEPNPGDYSEWSCILDENTNLVWQVKASQLSFSDRDGSTYTWYNPISFVNGGNEGFSSGESDDGSSKKCSSGICNTSAYVTRAPDVCGGGNWRLPSLAELLSIIDFESGDAVDESVDTVVDTEYFLHTFPQFYWTSTPATVLNDSAWCVYFGRVFKNHAQMCKKEEYNFVRLVKNYVP